MNTKILKGISIFGAIALGLGLYVQSGGQWLNYDGSRTAVSSQSESKVNGAAKMRIVESYGKTPMGFEENIGQIDEQVKFMTRGQGYSLFLTPTEAVLALSKPSAKSDAENKAGPKGIGKAVQTTESRVLRMSMVGANRSPAMAGIDIQAGKSNYIRGNDQSQWQTDVSRYSRVLYSEVYQGVDLAFHGDQRQLEYDFIVKPGASVDAIHLVFTGADSKEIDDEGNLILHLGEDKVIQHAPITYQMINGERQVIESKYMLVENGEIAFDVASYDGSKELIIDPVLFYSSFLPNNISGTQPQIAVDSVGNTYITDSTGANVIGAFKRLNASPPLTGGGSYVVVTKLNAAGVAIYSTYFGGSGTDSQLGVAADGLGNVYVTGRTDSPDLPGATGFMSGGFDAFVTKLDLSGVPVYSTYLGGANQDAGLSIAVDGIGNAYVAGYTDSPGFPITANAAQSNTLTSLNGFVSKLNTSGGLIYSTYIDSGASDIAYGIVVDRGGNFYVTGGARGNNLPTTINALQQTKLGLNSSAYVIKYNANGAIIYATYLGGSSFDEGKHITFDGSGNIYVTGTTASTDFPTKNNLPVAPIGGAGSISNGAAFVVKLDMFGALIYSSFLAGNAYVLPTGMDVDSGGNVYLAGSTNASNLPTTVDAMQNRRLSTGSATFITILDATGALTYSTYFGGAPSTLYAAYISDLVVDNAGNAYMTGFRQSLPFMDFPVPLTAPAITNLGGNFSFVIKFGLTSYQPPVPLATGIITNEDIAGSTVVNPNDPDVNDTHTFAITTAPSWGTASIDAGGTINYAPNANLNGTDSFIVTVTDISGLTGTVTVNVMVNPVNDAPTATSVTPIVILEDTNSFGVTPNVSDVDIATNADTHTFSIITQPANGLATIVANQLVYTPNANFNGSDPFTYSAIDTGGLSVIGTASVTVTPVNDAPTATNAAINTFDITFGTHITPTVVDIDITTNGDSHTFSIVTQPANGSASVVANQLIYTPQVNFSGADPFTYSATDTGGLSVIGTATVAVTLAQNSAPTSTSASISAVSGIPSSGITPTVVDVDIAIYGDTHTFAIITQPVNGSASVVSNRLVYTSNPNFAGADSFTYSATDRRGLSVTGTASVTVTLIAPGIISTEAGTGVRGSLGDNGPATLAQLNWPSDVAFDNLGNQYIADRSNSRIRKIDASGTITTIAGTGLRGFSGDGGPAALAQISLPYGIAVDGSGNIYFSDGGNHRIRKIDTSGMITTVAGTGVRGSLGDNGPASLAQLNWPRGISIDSAGNLYIGDYSNNRIRKIDVFGIITTAAGTGIRGFSGDGGPATLAQIASPYGAVMDSAGNLYISDSRNYRIRKVDALGNISTVAGTGLRGFSGDGGLATLAQLNWPYKIIVDGADNLYIVDNGNDRIRKIDAQGVITTIAGSARAGFFGEGIPATLAQLDTPRGIGFDSSGNLYIADGRNHRVRMVTSVSASGRTTPGTHQPPANISNAINTVAGTGVRGSLGDNGSATLTQLNWPSDVAFDNLGNQYIADRSNNRIRKIDASGTITTIAGTGLRGFSGDGGPAALAQISLPFGIAVDGSGSIYFSDGGNHRIRKIDTLGTITTIAGTGIRGFSGDGGPATLAQLQWPRGISIDSAGNLYIGDYSNNRIRKIDVFGIITTAAGNGVRGFSGDGGPAALAQVNLPYGAVADSAGNLYISDSRNYRIRKVDALGNISTVAGTGLRGFSGDGGLATLAQLNWPYKIIVDGADNLYIVDNGNDRIRKIDAQGVITTIAGSARAGFFGEGIPATLAWLDTPKGIGFDSSGNLYIADARNHRVRMVTGVGVPISATPPVNTNHPPAPTAAAIVTNEDAAGSTTVTPNDPDTADTHTFAITMLPSWGSATLGLAGSVNYVPNANLNGADSFVVTVTDSAGATGTVTVNVTINAVNDAPTATSATITTIEDTASAGLTPSVTDVDIATNADTHTFAIINQPANGSAAVVGNQLVYTPTANLNGADSFTYSATDAAGASVTGTAAVTVTPVNDVPVALNDVTSVAEDMSVIVSVLLNDSDVDGDPLTVSSVTPGANGTVAINVGGAVTYTPSANFYGLDAFSYTISDGMGGNATATVNVTVTPVNDAPVAVNDMASTVETTAVTVNVLSNDTDVDGDVLTISAITQGANGTVANNGINVVYTPNAAFVGNDTFTYTANDGFGGVSTATVTVTVIAVPVGAPAPTTVNVVAAPGQTVSNVNFTPTPPVGTQIPAGVSFAAGVVSYQVSVATPGATATTTLAFNAPLPVVSAANPMQLFKVDNAGVSTLIPQSQWARVGANSISLMLTDGGPFDLDGLANGVIVDPVAIGVPLTPAQISALTTAQIIALTPAQLATLLPSLTPVQIAVLTPVQIAALTAVQIAALMPVQIAGLTPLQLGAVLPMLTPIQITMLTPVQIAALTPIQLSALLPSLTPVQIAALSAIQLATFTPAQIAALTQVQIAALTATQIAALAPAQIAALTPAQIAALTAVQIGALTAAQIAVLPPLQLSTLLPSLTAHVDMGVKKAEVEWREMTDESGVKFGMTEIKVRGSLALPSWMPLSAVAANASVSIGLAGVADLMNQKVNFVVKGDKWKYKVKTAIGLKELEIKWKGAEFEFKDAASGVKLETEGDDLASTSLSVDVKGHEVMLLVNGQTLAVSLAGIVTSPYAYDQDEDGEVTFELPFGLTAASTIQLTINGVVQDIAVGNHYTPAQGSFELKAEVNAGSLTGAMRPATMDIGLSLGSLAVDGTASVANWTKLSNKEWKLKSRH